MARFQNSNRFAARQMARTARKGRVDQAGEIGMSYFERLGFDSAMI